MQRAAFLTLLLAVTLAGLVQAQTAPSAARPELETDLQLERKLLALDLVGYREARDREQRARASVAEAMQRLDQALSGSSLALGTLESLFDDLSAARAATQIAAERLDWQIQSLHDRMRRISFLEGEMGGRGVRNESVAGRWQVQIQPGNNTGVFDIRVDGTVVSGTYAMTGGAQGSLRGTFVENRLRLDRIDAKGGFDSVFLGTFDPAAQRITGSWTANELASGQPNRGEWTAARAGAGTERQP
jgi:hypothetical protein